MSQLTAPTTSSCCALALEHGARSAAPRRVRRPDFRHQRMAAAGRVTTEHDLHASISGFAERVGVIASDSARMNSAGHDRLAATASRFDMRCTPRSPRAARCCRCAERSAASAADCSNIRETGAGARRLAIKSTDRCAVRPHVDHVHRLRWRALGRVEQRVGTRMAKR